MFFIWRKLKLLLVAFVFGIFIGWRFAAELPSVVLTLHSSQFSKRFPAAYDDRTSAHLYYPNATTLTGDLPSLTQSTEPKKRHEIPYKELMSHSVRPLPRGYPPRPPQPVGVMSRAACIDYVRERQWLGQAEMKSQLLACEPQEPFTFKQFEDSECADLGKHPFTMVFCWQALDGHGSISIRRVEDCESHEGVEFSRDAPSVAHIRSRLGSDSFRIRLDGPEIVMVDMAYQGKCFYKGTFATSVEGWYTLLATLLFDHYDAVTELKSKTHYAVASVTGKAYRLGLTRVPEQQLPAPEVLPLCPAVISQAGRWVRRGYAWPFEDPAPDWKFPRIPGKNLAPFHNWGADADWTPYGCHWRSFNQSEALQCLAGQKILFIGDSMTRSFFYPVLNHLWENKILGNPKITVADGPRSWDVSNKISLHYYPDPFLDEERYFVTIMNQSRVSASREYDIVVMGLGDWPGSSSVQPKGLWPLLRYQRHIDHLAEELAGFVKRTGSRVFWHTIPAFGIADFDPWRNNDRFRLYDEYAVPKMRMAGLDIIDLFQVSYPMAHTAFDGGHYTTFVADLWADLLISHLCSFPKSSQA